MQQPTPPTPPTSTYYSSAELLELRQRLAEKEQRDNVQDNRLTSLETMMKQLIDQGEHLSDAVDEFKKAVHSIEIVITEIRGENKWTSKVLAGLGAVLLLVVGSFLGQIMPHFFGH